MQSQRNSCPPSWSFVTGLPQQNSHLQSVWCVRVDKSVHISIVEHVDPRCQSLHHFIDVVQGLQSQDLKKACRKCERSVEKFISFRFILYKLSQKFCCGLNCSYLLFWSCNNWLCINLLDLETIFVQFKRAIAHPSPGLQHDNTCDRPKNVIQKEIHGTELFNLTVAGLHPPWRIHPSHCMELKFHWPSIFRKFAICANLSCCWRSNHWRKWQCLHPQPSCERWNSGWVQGCLCAHWSRTSLSEFGRRWFPADALPWAPPSCTCLRNHCNQLWARNEAFPNTKKQEIVAKDIRDERNFGHKQTLTFWDSPSLYDTQGEHLQCKLKCQPATVFRSKTVF